MNAALFVGVNTVNAIKFVEGRGRSVAQLSRDEDSNADMNEAKIHVSEDDDEEGQATRQLATVIIACTILSLYLNLNKCFIWLKEIYINIE